MSTPCQTCLPIDCTKIIGVSQDIAEFGNGGYTFWNDTYTFVVNCPAGYNCSNGTWPRIITIPEGEIEINIPPNPGYVSIVCRGKTLVAQVPAGATPTQIQAAIQSLLRDCLEQYAIYNARNTPPVPHQPQGASGSTFNYYTNNELIEVGCTNGMPDGNQTNMVITARISVVDGIVTIQPSDDYITTHPSTILTADRNLYCPKGVPSGLHSANDVEEAIDCANHRALSYARQKHAELVADSTIICAPNPFATFDWFTNFTTTAPNDGTSSGTINGHIGPDFYSDQVAAVGGAGATLRTPANVLAYHTNTTGYNLTCRLSVTVSIVNDDPSLWINTSMGSVLIWPIAPFTLPEPWVTSDVDFTWNNGAQLNFAVGVGCFGSGSAVLPQQIHLTGRFRVTGLA